MQSSNKNVVWITGASSGIGRALTLEYARRSSVTGLVLAARRGPELASVKRACLALNPALEIEVLPMDVEVWPLFPSLVQRVVNRFGQIDLLIQAAGVSQRSLAVKLKLKWTKKFCV